MIEHFKNEGLDVGKVDDIEAIYVTPIYKTGKTVYIDNIYIQVYEYDLSDNSMFEKFDKCKETGEYPWASNARIVTSKRGIANGSLVITDYIGHPYENEIISAFKNFNN